jgi:DNA replication protein DnaC
MAERYERRSMLITSNLVFSEWERIFMNPMTTAAAIDRLVHHSVILEFDVASYRTEDARKRGAGGEDKEKEVKNKKKARQERAA